MFDWLDRLFNEHKLVRRFMVFWAMALITFATWVIFTGDPTSADYGMIIGLLGTAVGFYQWSRGKDK